MRLFFIYILFLNHCLSQTITVVDKQTKKPISYAVVFKDSLGSYTSKHGKFSINDTNIYKNLLIKHVGYEDLKISKNNIKDTLFLKPKKINLEQITIFDKGNKKIKLLRHKPYYGVTLQENSETISCFCSKKATDMIIKEFSIFLYSVSSTKKINDTIKHIFKFNIYENENFKPIDLKRKTLQRQVVEKEFYNKNVILKFDYTENPIFVDNKGICIGLEHITFRKEYNFKNILFISSSFSKKSKYFDFKGYLKYPLAFGNKLKLYSEIRPDKESPILIPDIKIYK